MWRAQPALNRIRKAIREWRPTRGDIRAYRRYPETDEDLIPFHPEVWGDEDWSDVYDEWVAEQTGASEHRSLRARLVRR